MDDILWLGHNYTGRPIIAGQKSASEARESMLQQRPQTPYEAFAQKLYDTDRTNGGLFHRCHSYKGDILISRWQAFDESLGQNVTICVTHDSITLLTGMPDWVYAYDEDSHLPFEFANFLIDTTEEMQFFFSIDNISRTKTLPENANLSLHRPGDLDPENKYLAPITVISCFNPDSTEDRARMEALTDQIVAAKAAFDSSQKE